jgi:hypothetical protein
MFLDYFRRKRRKPKVYAFPDGKLHVVLDHKNTFIEVENCEGRSRDVGHYIRRDDGLLALVIDLEKQLNR